MPLDTERVRADYPCLQPAGKQAAPIYMDNACMTLGPEPVLQAMLSYYREHPSCARRAVHAFGRRTTERTEAARRSILAALGGGDDDALVFTRNTTEAINLVARTLRFQPGDMVVSSDAEHNSNLLPWQMRSQAGDISHETFPIPPRDGLADLSKLRALLQTGRVKLLSVLHTSHVTGISLPVREMADLAHQHGAMVLVDAAQALPHRRLDLHDLGADLMAVSFHKAFGPTGIGALVGRRAALAHLGPFLAGGETVEDVDYTTCVLSPVPERFEAGLQDYAGMIGAAAAMDYMADLDLAAVHTHEIALNTIITEGLAGEDRVRLLGPADPALRGSVVNFEVDGIDAGELSILLDKTRGIMARAGVHCCHAWFRRYGLRPSLRLSLSAYNTQAEAEVVVDTLRKLLKFY